MLARVADDFRPPIVRSAGTVLEPLAKTVRHSRNFLPALASRPFEVSNRFYTIPKFHFVGPHGGGEFIRLGIFAGIHGDETASVLSLVRFLQALAKEPSIATGFEIIAFPVCNPVGFASESRYARPGIDLNREFWKGSRHPEIQILEEHLRLLHFHGIISLHTDDTSDGVYGFVRGAEFTRYVLDPALEAAAAILPRNIGAMIDGFNSVNGIIEQGYEGILSAPPEQKTRPFEIVWETPHHAAIDKQVEATILGLRSILNHYREFISFGQDL